MVKKSSAKKKSVNDSSSQEANNKSQSSSVVPQKGFQIGKLSLNDLFKQAEICFPSDKDMLTGAIENMIACALVILILVQIRIFHIKESPQFVDNLPSYRLYKRRIIQETPGRTICTSYALAFASGFINSDALNSWFISLLEFPIKTSKLIKNPTKENISKFIAGKCCSVLGTLQSCPATNLAMFGLTADSIANMDLEKALSFCNTGNFSFNKDNVLNILHDGFRTNSGGLKSPKVFLQEPIGWPSKIEQEIFEGFIERKGMEETFDSSDTTTHSVEELGKYLTPNEISGYELALKIGNHSNIAQYNQTIAKAKIAENKRVNVGDSATAMSLATDAPPPTTDNAVKAKD